MSSHRARHQRIQELFLGAEAQPAGQRETWLRRTCDDEAVVAEVLELLAHADDSRSLPAILAPCPPQVVMGSAHDLLQRVSGRHDGSPRYRDESLVGRGGMGAVFEVWDDELDRPLAKKVILGGPGSSQGATSTEVPPQVLERFVEEARITGQLDHPGIVPVHEFGLDAQGRLFFTMKLVRGQTLRQVFEEFAQGEGGWTQARVLGLLLRACEALSFAHSRGVIHRDLKPANVMVGRFGEVYVMDWGLARNLARSERHDLRLHMDGPGASNGADAGAHTGVSEAVRSPLRTMDGDVVGTPAYMSPEQARGCIEEIGPQSDVYSFGALLYHLLARHPPYLEPGARSNDLAVLRRVQAGPPAALNGPAHAAAPELVAICEKAMARDWRRRYSSMAELAADLSAFVEGRVVKAHAVGPWVEARKWVRRNRSLAAALAAAVLAAVAGAVGFALQADKATRAAEQAGNAAALAGEKADEALHNLALAERNEQEASRNLALARRNEAEAQMQRLRAEENERRARQETAKVLRLSDVKLLQELDSEADRLWPPYPDRIPQMEAWLDRAHELVAGLPGHRSTLVDMRARTLPWSDAEREGDRVAHPGSAGLAARMAQPEDLGVGDTRQLQDATAQEPSVGVDAPAALDATLQPDVASRRTWLFASPEDQWQHDVLVELIEHLEDFEAGLLGEDAISPDHGWSVPRRLGFARDLQAGFAEGGAYARAWADMLPAIRETYPGLDLAPQMGLLPIGPDPASGLWEFAHLATGQPPQRGEAGRLVMAEETGVVLVLLAGGTFWMGAQSTDPGGRNYDPYAQSAEGPPHEVELSPHLLSKYELTQGQWLRMTGRNPSYYQRCELAPTLLHPVEQVSWADCMTWLQRAGLTLPSEAQWEYGARAGTDSPWWTGTEPESLLSARAANVADRSAARFGAIWASTADLTALDDGAVVHAQVGSYAANALGLHDVAGNVWEWCLDGYEPGYFRRSPRRDPVCPWENAGLRVPRGGAFNIPAIQARSSRRTNATPGDANANRGVRPAAELALR